MTEAKKKNKQQATDNRISTHPSYTEYSWDSLVGSEAGAVASSRTAATANLSKGTAVRGSNVKRSTAAAKRPASGISAGNARVRRNAGERKQYSNTAARTAAVGASNTAKSVEVKNAAKVKVEKKVSIHTIAVEKKYTFPLSIVLLALCFTLLIMAIVTTAVQINEITSANSDLESKYNSMVSDENELRLLLETRDDLRVVEQMAKEELGMVKIDQVERYYLTVHQEDKIEIVEDEKEAETGIFDGIADFGNSIVERIRGFFGM